MLAARSAPAILLGNGKVLIAGGYSCDSSGNCASLNSAEIYDPVAGTFSNAGTMTVDRYAHTMTLLNNGKVLIAGGESCTSSTTCSALQTAEIYDPASGTFSASGSLNAARFNAAAVALTSGQVLIAGGFDGTNFPANAELFDPIAGTFTATVALNTPRASATATLLDNGSVVIAGGSTCSSTNCPTATAELYASGAFSTISNLTVSRVDQTATLLTNGQLLIAGGYTACSSSCVSDSTTELFDPQASSFTAGQGLSAARSQHTATLLNDGTVLLVGGINNGQSLSGTDVYHPSSLALPELASITITPANPSIAPGAIQPLTAMGFDSGANLLGALQAVIWSSSAPSVATVTNAAGSAGVVNSLTPGTTTITATVGGVTGSTQVTVPAPPSLVSLAITPSNPSITLDLSSPIQLDVKGTYSDGSTQDLTTSATWTTSNSSIAQILADPNAPGIVYGVAAGTTNVAAAYDGINTSNPITILPTPATPNPTIASISPTSGVPGTQVVINGSGFGASQSNAYILLGSTPGVISSWSDTQIVAVVANGSTSGTAQIQEGEVTSNSLPFTINTATISAVSPSSGVAGTQVVITGSGFGSTQGNGLVWLGNAVGVVTNWTDTEVDASVSPGALSGNAQVLQNGEWSNAVPFTVPGNPLISSISPNSGPTGTTVTISGSGFGSSQGSGAVSIGAASAPVLSWSDTQIQATVSGSAVTGVAKIQENNTWSNAKAFTVTGNFGSNPAATLVPDVVSMSVGDTRTIQALDSNNQPLTGLTWSSSDTTIASLSADDPPIITALAAGNVTITAGTGSADITVYAGALPLGTTIWSNPGNASGVQQIVPAVPSSTGIADVFALQNDCSVQAIASDGSPGWTANIGSQSTQNFGGGCKKIIPDFQGGLLSIDPGGILPGHPGAVQKFDGMTGQPYPSYSFTTPASSFPPVVAHTDGTIFTIDGDSVVAIDPTTGTPKFKAKMEHSTYVHYTDSQCDTTSVDQLPQIHSNLIIAGDGYAYVLYSYGIDSLTCAGIHLENHARVLRVGTGGDSSEIVIGDSTEDIIGPYQSNQLTGYGGQIITNADQGVLIALYVSTPNWCAYNATDPITGANLSSGCVPFVSNYQLITTSGSSISSRVTLPSTIDYLVPILQAQDGTFYGIVDYTGGEFDNLAKFDQSGNIQWSKQHYYALMATSDGGVIAQTAYPYNPGFIGVPYYSGPAITFDANGNQTGQLRAWERNLGLRMITRSTRPAL